jgi:hypothetical protein
MMKVEMGTTRWWWAVERSFPFTKRDPYTCEGEFRAIWEGNKNSTGYAPKIDLGLIRKITISPILPEELCRIVRECLIDKLDELNVKAKINPSTIYRNRKWIAKFRRAAAACLSRERR